MYRLETAFIDGKVPSPSDVAPHNPGAAFLGAANSFSGPDFQVHV
jgi:hypothetical protein